MKKYGHRYPWRKWFLLRRVVIVRGVDFFCRTDTMRQMIYAVADKKKYRKKVRLFTSDDGSEIVIRILGDKIR